MAFQTIRYLIRPDGRVEETVESVPGPACRSLTERIEARLGSIEHRQATAEAYLSAPIAASQVCQPLHDGSGP